MNVPDAVFRVTGTFLVGAFAYEGIALTTGRYPTVTDLCRKYRWLEVGIAVAYLAHMHVLKEIVADACPVLSTGAGDTPAYELRHHPGPFPGPGALRPPSHSAARSRRPDCR